MATVKLVMQADYFADPLWLRADNGLATAMVSLDSLPISERLKSDLRMWAGRFDDIRFSDYAWPSEHEHSTWIEQGRELYTALLGELGPQYDVAFRPEVPG